MPVSGSSLVPVESGICIPCPLASLNALSHNLRFTTFWLLLPLSGFKASSLSSCFSEHGFGEMNSIKYYSESKEHSLQNNITD
jgi:hypothetical protein